MATDGTLGGTLKAARTAAGLSLRDVERRTGVRSGHLSQIETNTIARPEMAILWELAATYGVDFGRLLALAGYGGHEDVSNRQRQQVGEVQPVRRRELPQDRHLGPRDRVRLDLREVPAAHARAALDVAQAQPGRRPRGLERRSE